MIRRLAAAVAAAAAVAVMSVPAAPGQVPQDKPVGTPLTMTPDQRDTKTMEVTQQGATVSGQFSMNGPQGRVEEIDIRVDYTLDPKNPVVAVSDTPVCQNSVNPCGQQTVPFSYPLPPLAYNGPYDVTAWAFGSDVATSHTRSDDVTLPGGFKLAVPPVVPQHVTAAYDKNSGFNVVRWDRNPEPDLRLYVIQHKGPSDKDFKVMGSIGQPKSGAQVAIAEPASPGAYEYRVDAKRAGADPKDPEKDIDSGYSDPPAKVTVPVPPPGATTPHGSPPAPAPKPVAKSQLPKPRTSSGSSSSGATTLTTESVSPDAGFARGSADVPSTIPGGADDSGRAIAILPKSKHDSSGRLAVLGPVAGGAVLFMFAFHLRYLKGRLDQIPPPA